MKRIYFSPLIIILAIGLHVPAYAADQHIKKHEPSKLLLAAGVFLGAVCLSYIIKAIYREATKTNPERAQELAHELNTRQARYQNYLALLDEIQQTNDSDERKERKERIIARVKAEYLRASYPVVEFSDELAGDIAWARRAVNWLAIRQHAVPNGIALNHGIQQLSNSLPELQDILLTTNTYDKERNSQRKDLRRKRELEEKRAFEQRLHETHGT